MIIKTSEKTERALECRCRFHEETYTTVFRFFHTEEETVTESFSLRDALPMSRHCAASYNYFGDNKHSIYQ